MSQTTAYCGYDCHTCPIFLATRVENKEEQAKKRAEIARRLKEQYGMKYEPEEVTDCDGCRTEAGRLFTGCKDCPIRNCARPKGLENCAHCPDYVCGKLEAFFAKEPTAKALLDELRSRIA
jgi:hypothetical protein